MSHQPTVSEETELGGLPHRLPDQNAVLVGRVTGDSEFTGEAAYYLPGEGAILLGQYENQEFMPKHAVESEKQLMSACVRDFSTVDVKTDLSTIGKVLLQAWHFGDLTPLSHKQAHVYALRENGACTRDETAAILNISPSTVDTHLQRAKEKLTAAENLVQFVNTDAAELSVANPDFFDEAGIDADANNPDDITSHS